MPTCPQCHHKWQSVRKVKALRVSTGSDPGPAQWVGCQGEQHETDWGDKVRTTCAADASFGRHPGGCPCTWCASRRALGWVRNAVPDGKAAPGSGSGTRHSRGWDYVGMEEPQRLCPETDWQAFREARRAAMGDRWTPHHMDSKDAFDRYNHAQSPAGKAGVPYVAPEGGAV